MEVTMDIQVITHNGKMPKDGGHRIAFTAGGYTFDPLLGPIVTPRPAAKVKKEEQPIGGRDGIIVYSDLKRTVYSDEECFYCHAYSNRKVLMETDQGRKYVVRCKSCRMIMRPYRS